MKPKSNKSNKNKKSKFFMQQKSTPTVIPLKNYDQKDIEYFQRNLLDSIGLGHRPEKCCMCNGSEQLLTYNNVQRMDLGNFEWHFNMLFNRDGQRLNSRLIRMAFKQYRTHVEAIRQHNKGKGNSGHIISVRIGVLASVRMQGD